MKQKLYLEQKPSYLHSLCVNPDCSSPCSGTWDIDTCSLCECKDVNITLHLVDKDGWPIAGAAMFVSTRPWQHLGITGR